MFNIQGSELIFLLLIALIILGPEKLPDAIRKFGRAYAEFKKMANGFQGEIRQVLDEPMRELRDTADAMRAAVNFDEGATPTDTSAEPADVAPPPAAPREKGLNFGQANPRRQPGGTAADAPPAEIPPAAAESPALRPQGLNFGSTVPRRPPGARDPLAAAGTADAAAPVDSNDTPTPEAADDSE